MVRDLRVARHRKQNRKTTAKRRLLLRLASGRNRKNPAKLRKKSKLAAPVPSHYQSWPVLRPSDLISSMLDAGFVDELILASTHVSQVKASRSLATLIEPHSRSQSPSRSLSTQPN